jgi:hypothetical protein
LTAPITFLVSFALPFGGSVALTLMATVFNNKSGLNHTDPKRGIHYAFIAMIPFMWLFVLMSAGLGNVWIMKDGNHEVVNGSYLLSLITRKKLDRVRMHRGDDAPGNNVAVKDGLEEGANGDEKEKKAEV